MLTTNDKCAMWHVWYAPTMSVSFCIIESGGIRVINVCYMARGRNLQVGFLMNQLCIWTFLTRR
jgi:hypothetical protein